MSDDSDDLAKRGRERSLRMVSHRSSGHQEAEKWDLAYWQSVGYEGRLDAYMAIRDDVELVHKARDAYRSGL
jgi:hypothetical protein